MTETVIVTIAHLDLCLKSKQRGNSFHHAVLPHDGSYCIYEEKANKMSRVVSGSNIRNRVKSVKCDTVNKDHKSLI